MAGRRADAVDEGTRRDGHGCGQALARVADIEVHDEAEAVGDQADHVQAKAAGLRNLEQRWGCQAAPGIGQVALGHAKSLVGDRDGDAVGVGVSGHKDA